MRTVFHNPTWVEIYTALRDLDHGLPDTVRDGMARFLVLLVSAAPHLGPNRMVVASYGVFRLSWALAPKIHLSVTAYRDSGIVMALQDDRPGPVRPTRTLTFEPGSVGPEQMQELYSRAFYHLSHHDLESPP